MAADDTSQTGQLRASLQELHRQLTASGTEPGSDDYARPAEDILDATEHLLAASLALACYLTCAFASCLERELSLLGL